MKRTFLFVLTGLLALILAGSALPCSPLRAQDDAPLPFADVDEFYAALETAANSGDIDPFWETVVATGRMPLIFDTTAVFLYRGEAETVAWQGGFSGWEVKPDFVGVRQGETDLWVMQHDFPRDARLNYEILVDGYRSLLDPLNPYQEDTGLGMASELRMPDWVFPVITLPRDDIAHGTLTGDIRIDSRKLAYAVTYRVYTPAGYDELDTLPVIYVMDGQWYIDPLKGNMPTVLDNLIADGAIQPVIAVFIDPRNPDLPSDNRRADEYYVKPAYTAFVTTELVPTIDAVYRTNPHPDARAILGTSLGGLNAAYFGWSRSDTFHLIAIQSPAFQLVPWILTEYKNTARLPLTIFMSVGTIWDGYYYARQMRDIMEAQGYPLLYIEVADEHAWGNWRALLDDLLIYFFAPA